MCPGIADFSQQYSAIHGDVQGLRKICVSTAVIKYESEKCLKWHIPQNQKVLPSDRTFNVYTVQKSGLPSNKGRSGYSSTDNT